MGLLDGLMNQVKKTIEEKAGNGAAGGLIKQATEVLGNRKSEQKKPEERDIKPASQDPYGDPADQK